MHKVALVINRDKPLAIAAGHEIIASLQRRGVQAALDLPSAQAVGRPELGAPDHETFTDAGLVLVLGGDGTLIRAAKQVAPYKVPLLGINAGHLGFLTELEEPDIKEHLEQFLSGEFVLERRMMLTAKVIRDDQVIYTDTALNDAVVAKGLRGVVHLDVAVGETHLAQYPADGVVVATPTGSTAYSLSAGGPIVGPTVDVLLITPICPHTITSRAVVVSADQQVTVTVIATTGAAHLSWDGSEPVGLLPGDRVVVTRAENDTLLARRHSYRFYDVLKEKLADPNR